MATKPAKAPPLSARDFLRDVPPPAWLQKAWDGARQRGIDQLTEEEINAEIDAYRKEKNEAAGAKPR